MNDMNEKAVTSNVLPFARPATSDDGGTGNWLRDMVHGTRFLANRKAMNDSKLIDFIVASDPKSMPAVFIGEDCNSPEGAFRFVDPKKFIRDYDFFCTLEIIERPNGDSNKLLTSSVDGDVKSTEQPEVHEGEQRVPPGDEPRSV